MACLFGVSGCSHFFGQTSSDQVRLEPVGAAPIPYTQDRSTKSTQIADMFVLRQQVSQPSNAVQSGLTTDSRFDLDHLQAAFETPLPLGPPPARATGWSATLYDPILRLETRDASAAHLFRLDQYLGNRPYTQEQGVSIDYSRSFIAGTALGKLDIGFTPRASLAIGPDGNATRLGALVSIGENLKETRTTFSNWYVFAGGGAEALTFEPGSGRSLVGGLRLEEKTLVGDAQAGIAMRLGRANLSLAYIRRETGVTSRLSDLNNDRVENFTALTLTMGR